MVSKTIKNRELEYLGNRAGALSRTIIDFLFKGGLVFLYVITDALSYPWGRRKSYRVRYQSIYQSVKRLEKQGLVTVGRQGNNISIFLTDRGYRFAEQMAILSLKIEPQKLWDRRWRLVVFDIPENHRVVRNVLRTTLQTLGFSQLQKSVFVIPWSCREVIARIQRVYFAYRYIRYIEATTFDGEANYLKRYNLSIRL